MKKTIFLVLCVCHSAMAATHYVDLNNATPSSPYRSWATAATNIQDAVDEAVDGEIVLVADGTYSLSSQITVTRNITIRSVNGKSESTIDGEGVTRCFNLGSSSCVIDGFTISNGFISGSNSGGGILCDNANPLILNCSFLSNYSKWGGGIAGGTTSNSVFISNSAANHGGGVYSGSLSHAPVKLCQSFFDSVSGGAEA